MPRFWLVGYDYKGQPLKAAEVKVNPHEIIIIILFSSNARKKFTDIVKSVKKDRSIILQYVRPLVCIYENTDMYECIYVVILIIQNQMGAYSS